MTNDEVKLYETRAFFRDSLRLRLWDDAAKIVGMETSNLDHFAQYIDRALEVSAN